MGVTTTVAVLMDVAGMGVEVTHLRRHVLVEFLILNGHTAANQAATKLLFRAVGFAFYMFTLL